MPYTSQALPLGVPMARPERGAAEYRHPASSALINPMEVRPELLASGDCRYKTKGNGYAGAGVRFESSVHNNLNAGFEEVGAIGGALSVPLDVRSVTSAVGTVVRVIGLASQHYKHIISGGYGARAKTAGVAKCKGHRGMADDVVRTDQAMVRVCDSWTSQTGAIERREPNGRFEQATHNGRFVDVDTAIVAGSTAKVTRRTSSI